MTKTSMQLCALTLTVALGLSVSATASLLAGDTKADMPKVETTVVTNHAAKTSRIAVDDDRQPRYVRCVARNQTTTCTGWPVADGVVVGSL